MSTGRFSRLRLYFSAWGPIIAMMAIMYVASDQPKTPPPPGSSPDDIYFSEAGYLPLAIPVFPHEWEFLLKKGAHVVAYAVLTGLNLRGLLLVGLAPREGAALAVLIAISYAVMDELHQACVSGRSASVLDIAFDYAGALLAGLGGWWLVARARIARALKTTPASPHQTLRQTGSKH
ncbi:MAG: hypothetical protein GYB65_11380 [Chloroflexi bacterium]|nr:hypothetical protein [Chloroflexota bacterium]